VVEVNPNGGVLIIDKKRLEGLQIPVLAIPNQEVPVWVITDKADLDPRVRTVKNLKELCKILKANDGLPIPDVDQNGKGWKDAVKALEDIKNERIKRQEDIRAKIKEAYKDWKWPKTPKVMAITTRFSSVMRWSCLGILNGFRQNGHETCYVCEEDNWERYQTGIMGPDGQMMYCLPVLKKILEFKPDMMVHVNFYRNPMLYPPCIPVYTHVQDRLPQNLNPQVAQTIGERDFIGHVCTGFMDKWLECNFPLESMMVDCWGYDEEIFYPPEDESQREKKVVYVEQNGSIPPELAFEKFMSDYQGAINGNVRIEPIIRDFHASMTRRFSNPLLDASEYEYEATWADIYAKHMMIASQQGNPMPAMPPEMRRTFLWKYCHDVGGRWMRQRPLEAVANSGLPLELYGKGWGNHPRLRQCDKGELSGMEALGDLYRKSHVVMQLQYEVSFSQRVLEGLACGAHVAVKRLEVDFERANEHCAVSTYKYPHQAPQCIGQLLNMPPAPIDQTGIQNYSYKAITKRVMERVNDRMNNL
jgi:hypothetical protein